MRKPGQHDQSSLRSQGPSGLEWPAQIPPDSIGIATVDGPVDWEAGRHLLQVSAIVKISVAEQLVFVDSKDYGSLLTAMTYQVQCVQIQHLRRLFARHSKAPADHMSHEIHLTRLNDFPLQQSD